MSRRGTNLTPSQVKSKVRKYKKFERVLRKQAKEFKDSGQLAAFLFASASADVYRHAARGDHE